MLKTLERTFAPSLNSPLYEERLRDNLRWTIAVIIGGLLVAFALNEGTNTRIAFAVLAAVLAGLMFLTRSGLTVARVATPLVTFLTLSWLVLMGAGLQDSAVVGFFVVIVAARAVGSGASTLIYLLLTMAVFAAAYVMEQNGWTGEPTAAPSGLDRLGNLYIVLVAMTASIWFLAKNMEDDRDSAYEVLQEIETHQEALAEKEEQYRLLADNSQDFIWTSDLDFNYTYCSPACERIMGYTASELQGRSIFFRVEPQSDIDSFRQNLRDAMNLDTPEEASDSITFPEVRFTRKDGQTGWADVHLSYLRDDWGNVIGIIGTSRDITDRIHAQVRAEEIENQLRQAQKIDSIGQLAGGIAHDFNNMLVAIQGYSDLAAKHKSTTPEVKRYVSEIKRASVKAKNLTTQLLTFSRRHSMDSQWVSVNQLVTEVQGMLSRLIPATVNVNLELDDALPGVMGDSGQLEQLIVNLCVNARDAMAGGGTLTLRSDKVALSEIDAEKYPSAEPGDYVRLSVCDTGVGMEPELLERVFDPFFTTKSEGDGTGLGLSVVHGIVVEHGGYITLESREGIGTTVQVHLPVAAEDSEQLPALPEAEEVDAPGTETVLVVEDEEQVRSLATLILSQAGYTVLTAEDGMLGWELFLSQRDKISAIVCDVVMPNMGGRQLLRLVRELDEHVPFLFVSGYVGGSNPQNFAEHYQVEFLQKPFSAASLQQKVREILDHRVASVPAKKRVLAVDDNDSILHLLELDVVELGHEIVTASSGEAAVDAADQLDFDVVFMDLQMSPVDGVEATQSIRARQGNRPRPAIIGLTAHCTDEEYRRCIDAGMDDIITKPIRYDRLSELLGGNRSDEEDDTAARLRAPVFDLDVSLHLANNRSEVAEEMFAILMGRLQEDQAAIRQAFDDGDMKELAGQVHKLNGAVRYCGVPALMHAVNELETTVKNGDPAEVRDGLADVDGCIEELVAWHVENPDPFSTRDVPDAVSHK